MKNSILVLVVLFTCSFSAFAQAGFGLKAGVNYSNLAVNEDQINDANAKVGFTAGFVFRRSILGEWLMLQPEVLYTVKGAKYETANNTINANLQYVDIPVLGVLRVFNTPLTIHAGPQFSFLTRAKYEYEGALFADDTVVDDDRDNYRQWDYGFVGGLGFELNNLLIEARYSRGLRSVENDRTILQTPFDANDTKNYGFQLTGTILF